MEAAKALADFATAIATVILALATVVVAFAAWIQLPSISKQVGLLAEQIRLSRVAEANNERRTREWETLKACERYDFDPVLEAAASRLWQCSDNGTNYTIEKIDQRDAIALLNYLDGLSTGINQNLYIEDVIRDHLGSIFEHAYISFIDTKIVDPVGLEKFCETYQKWFAPPKKTAYESRPAS